MKKRMIGLVALTGLVAGVARGQTYESRELMNYNGTNSFGTNIVIGASVSLTANSNRTITNRVTASFFCAGATAEIHASFQLRGAGTSAVIFGLEKSYDGQMWDDAGLFGVAATGNTLVQVRTNITMGYYGYLKIYDIENQNATAVTNLNIRYTSSR